MDVMLCKQNDNTSAAERCYINIMISTTGWERCYVNIMINSRQAGVMLSNTTIKQPQHTRFLLTSHVDCSAFHRSFQVFFTGVFPFLEDELMRDVIHTN